jgi:hypothetical protein
MRKGAERMSKYEQKEYREEELKRIEHTLRDAEYMMRALYPNFNSYRNAERFIHSCLKANEALRQIQRGNMQTVTRYWRDEE